MWWLLWTPFFMCYPAGRWRLERERDAASANYTKPTKADQIAWERDFRCAD